MINGEIVRVNSIDRINLGGYIVKLFLHSKLPTDKWNSIVSGFRSRLESEMVDKEQTSHIKVMQSVATQKCNFHIPLDASFGTVSSLMLLCYTYSQDLKATDGTELSYLAMKTNLEQTFLAYAARQKINDQGNAR